MNRFMLVTLVLFAGGALVFAGAGTSANPPQVGQGQGTSVDRPGEAGSAVLWEIGKADRSNAEFALAPGDYAKFKNDGFFVVGASDAKKDWPYVQPGPVDGWAGGRAHRFVVLFGLKATPAAGECRLQFDLIDTHSSAPPKLRVEVNAKPFEQALPSGAGDASVNGQPDRGRSHQFAVAFPANLLKIGDNEIRITTVSGSWMLYDSLALAVPAGAELGDVQSRTLLEDVRPIRALRAQNAQMRQPVLVTLRHFGEDADAVVRIEGIPRGEGILPLRPSDETRRQDAGETQGRDGVATRGRDARDTPTATVRLKAGSQEVQLLADSVTAETKRQVILEVGGKTVASREITLKPVRKMTVYITPHSHTDIGYTEIQTAIEKRQVQNLLDGMAAAKRTADYPPGARFVWNVEVLWAADLYLHRLDDQQRADFLAAVKSGQVVLNGMYLNELTGLCRPEELVRLFRYSTELAQKTGVRIDSVMISDVPGYTWGTVTAMASAGIRYFSAAPNYFDRIGTILREWENKPFYWLGPDGRSKVLVWIPFWGYAMSHRYGQMSPQLVEDFSDGLEKRGYPFDIAYVRWSGHGDNAVPDPAICEFVKDWNAKYTWPHFVICGTSEAFHAMEDRYGDKLPVVRGDWTPYWEDGAGSSALETAMNRASSDRLAQAETLFAMRKPSAYSAKIFEQAWNDVLLYSEHTWGAWCSVSGPERKETKEQWGIKKGYALAADKQSRELLAAALEHGHVAPPPSGVAPQTSQPRAAGLHDSFAPPGAVDVFNTLSWPRTELVTLSRELSTAGDRVVDDQGKVVLSQRLATGALVFLARAVPPLAARRYVLGGSVTAEGPSDGRVAGVSPANRRRDAFDTQLDAATRRGSAFAQGATIGNGIIHVQVDEKTGGIIGLTVKGVKSNFADTTGGEALNDYLYLIGDNVKDIKRNGPVTIRVGEKGPLVASLLVESAAPGCKKLVRELRVVAGLDYVECINMVDKERLPAKSYMAKEGKESLNFAFPFAVPGGDIWLDLPLGMIRPEADQMRSACKNWFTVGRWADVSNRSGGVTWVTLDAPLVQVGGITATLLNSQTNPDIWRKRVELTQKLYSWAMNNHWGTNYCAYQEGPTVFRFILRPHRRRDLAEASRFATGFSQSLVPIRASGANPSGTPLLRVEPADVLVTALKPSDDGRGVIVRLFGASAKAKSATLKWGSAQPSRIFLSDTSEHAGKPVGNRIEVPASGLVTLRAEFK